MTYFHFTGATLRDGQPIPPIGEWLSFDGEPIMCECGLHASEHPFDALQYAPGEFLHKVELDGIAHSQRDKVVARKRKIVATIDATDVLRRFARSVALDVAHLWNPPDVVLDYLKTGDESKRAAARAAARDAARAAAGDAAWDAAWVAALAAAGDAALAAARAAAGDKYRNQFAVMVEEEFSRQTVAL